MHSTWGVPIVFCSISVFVVPPIGERFEMQKVRNLPPLVSKDLYSCDQDNNDIINAQNA
jgi:hypothetical protein